jgi:glycosyltransferase involved in cell wall biosynthesis
MSDKLKKHIVIDATPGINDIRAIKRYCRNLVQEMNELPTEFQIHLLYLGIKDKNQVPLFQSPHIEQKLSFIPGKVLTSTWNLFNAPKISKWIKEDYKLIHFPGGLPYIPCNSNNIITTMHGFVSKYIPQYFSSETLDKLNKNLEIAIKKSNHFITVSESNKKELMELWDIPQKNITAIPLGISREFQIYKLNNHQKHSILKKYNLPDKPYILFVGALAPHKNIKNIILAYNKLPESLKQQNQLLFVGKETEHCLDYKDLITSLNITDNVSFVDYIQPGSLDLAYIYNLAKIFVFPSFYEGWASPPLEAMKCGTPTTVSDIPSLRESTGDNSLYFNQEIPDEISVNIQKLLEDQKLYDNLREKGLQFAKQYTWKNCAKKTLELYKSLL